MRFLSVCSETMTHRVRDITGHRNGRLVAVKILHIRQSDFRAMWLCQCDCGNTKVVAQNNLTRDSGTKSCGCLRREAAQRRVKRDGPWNRGKTYAIQSGERRYTTRHSWAKALIRRNGTNANCAGGLKLAVTHTIVSHVPKEGRTY